LFGLTLMTSLAPRPRPRTCCSGIPLFSMTHLSGILLFSMTHLSGILLLVYTGVYTLLIS